MMDRKVIDEIKIIPKPDYITWEQITELLHLAFAEKKEKGMSYLATHQDAETTKKRVGDGVCLVALIDDKLVGTASFQIKTPDKFNKRWHNEKLYAYASQLAVHSDFKGMGLGNKLQSERIRLCAENNVDELLGHTSIYAKEILSWWKRQGAQYVEFISSAATNYYAIRFRIPIKGKRYNNIYVAFRYYVSYIKCIVMKNRYGKHRWVWRVIGSVKK